MAPPSGIDETAAKAHYSLGVLMASSGRGRTPSAICRRPCEFSPNYVEAYQALADALRRSGRIEQSLTQYDEALRVNPKSADARFGYGMALVGLDVIARRATGSTRRRGSIPIVRSSRTRSRACWRRRPTTAFAMGSEHRRSSSACCRAGKTIDLGETMAMALAERGQFAEAVAIQRSVMEAAIRSGFDAVSRRMAANLLSLRAPPTLPDAVGQRRPDSFAGAVGGPRPPHVAAAIGCALVSL